MSKDVTGQSQFLRNVYVGWFMQLFVMVAGFVVPRQINDSLGAASLGIWDFGWATARYLSMTNMGMAGALTRYSGKYRAAKEFAKLTHAYSAVFLWQSLVSILALAASLVLAWNVGSFIDLPPEEVDDARWVLALLGGSIAISMWTSPWRGLISGYHRWDILHTLNGLHDFFIALAVVILLAFFDVGLAHLAAVVCVAAIVLSAFRYYYVKKICYDFPLSVVTWNAKEAKRMLVYGSKLMLSEMPQMVLFQSIAIIIASASGPVVLAIFNRGIALVRICERFIRRSSTTYTPIVSSLIGLDKREEAKQLLVEATQFSVAMTLPMILGLVFFGDFVLEIWMGPEYRDWPMLTIMSLGALFPIAFKGTISVLTGLNAIGRLSLIMFVTTVVVLTGSALVVEAMYEWNTQTAAIVLSVSWTGGSALVVPFYIYSQFSISPFKFFFRGIVLPILCCVPLIGALMFARQALFDLNLIQAGLACALGGIVTLLIYMQFVFPEHVKKKIFEIIDSKVLKRFS